LLTSNTFLFLSLTMGIIIDLFRLSGMIPEHKIM
jgi:hypothetical protein